MFGFLKKSQASPDLSFIGADMHSHLLPNLDDGSKSMEDTLHFIQELNKLGYEKLICTPHILSSVHPNTPQTILPRLAEVQQALHENNIKVKVEAAAEYMVDYDFEQLLKSGDELLTFGKNFILIEMSYLAPSPNIGQVIFDLRLRGLQPIIAHPERYNYYHHQFNQYKVFKDKGCWLQVNLLSLAGYYGKPIKKVAEKLIAEGMIDLIGTDMHHINHLNATKQLALDPKFYKILKDTPLKNRMFID
ncbi:MAG: histidinol phosphatase [Chitinophagales bacterium]|nr:histidinol phosphatase [Chitinophagales bacterium]